MCYYGSLHFLRTPTLLLTTCEWLALLVAFSILYSNSQTAALVMSVFLVVLIRQFLSCSFPGKLNNLLGFSTSFLLLFSGPLISGVALHCKSVSGLIRKSGPARCLQGGLQQVVTVTVLTIFNKATSSHDLLHQLHCCFVKWQKNHKHNPQKKQVNIFFFFFFFGLKNIFYCMDNPAL